jgi:Phage integrase, N-terminal SAM-like domain
VVLLAERARPRRLWGPAGAPRRLPLPGLGGTGIGDGACPYTEPGRAALTVGGWLREWIETRQGLAPSTLKAYREHIGLHLEPGLGLMPLTELNVHDLMAFYRALVSRRRTRGCAPLWCIDGSRPRKRRNSAVTVATVAAEFVFGMFSADRCERRLSSAGIAASR